MSSRAVIWNPLASAHGRHRLLIYHNSTKNNIAVRQWSPEDTDPWVKTYQEHAQSPVGAVKVGGEFAALLWRDWVRAYGIIETKPNSGGAPVSYISLLAPVPQSLGITTRYNRLAGTSFQTPDGKDKGWLYYLNNDPPVIHERALDSTSSGTPIAKTLNLMSSAQPAITDLAACYASKLERRFVFFQTIDGKIHAYDVKASAGTADHLVTGAEAARHGTPLAAASFVSVDKDVIVVYWIHSSDGLIYRSHSIDAGFHWNTESLDGAAPASPETLAVAPNSDLKNNTLVYTAASEEADIQAWVDDWETFVRQA
ncbi:hypothetical protein Trco_001504 [Trichoderma cornu-damae]|uniref:Fucose-specific lectin n=1 Tax=Trichoderma cornu-damae TaxID=654480 RepID=A0A9P8U1B0_9HYPO|nr:hypothetical protein Trco_001504 [Trichoderma cornu-damae]